jgi:hypothetical protein
MKTITTFGRAGTEFTVRNTKRYGAEAKGSKVQDAESDANTGMEELGLDKAEEALAEDSI